MVTDPDTGGGGRVPDVTVVVAVYNPGRNIDGLLASLHGQSLPEGALEVVLVDDGSTDGTREHLEGLATTRPYLVVRSIPNSGWPGRPRNVGLDAARGEFVFFADHDDEFFPESLARMVSMGRENRSDIVYGKIVRTGRPTPYWGLAHHDVADADLTGDVLTSRTVHKLYRRQWLLDLGARFPEGRVRLEDHVFMAQVLPHARTVSVLASYPCYRWIHRPDGTNSSDMVVDPDVYWEFYSGVLRVFEREAGPGRMLDEARRQAAIQCFSRFPVRELEAMTPEQRSGLLQAVHRYVAEQVPPSLDASLPVLKRLRLQALRDGGTERFLALHEASSRLTARAVLAGTSAGWSNGRLTLHARSELVRRAQRADGTPVDLAAAEPAVLQQVRDDVLVPLDLLGGGTISRSALSDSLTTGDRALLPGDRGSLELTVRHRESGVEWPLGGEEQSTLVGLELADVPGAVTLRAQRTAVLQPATAAFGRPLGPGIWDVMVRSQFLGEHQTRRLPAPEQTSVVLLTALTFPGADAQLEALPYRTADGTLALKVTDPVEARARRPHVTAFAWDDDRLTMHVGIGAVHEPAELVVRERDGAGAAAFPVQGGIAVVDLSAEAADVLGGPVLDVYARPAGSDDAVRGERVSYAVPADQLGAAHPACSVYATTHGSLSLKRLTAPAPRGRRVDHRSGLRRLLGRRTGG
jgi:glycosyltransferase involved in cell wall biosynthesis